MIMKVVVSLEDVNNCIQFFNVTASRNVLLNNRINNTRSEMLELCLRQNSSPCLSPPTWKQDD